MIVNDDKAHKAVSYLASTDEQLGPLKARMKGLEHRIKTLKAQVYLESKGQGTDGDRKAMSEVHTEVVSLQSELENAFADCEIVMAKRKTAELLVEIWRTENSNRRAGIIT